MSNSPGERITDYAPFFLEAANSTHRQYEALRAYFVDHLPSQQEAQRFGYSQDGYAEAKSRHIFRDFIDATGQVTLTEQEIQVRFQKRAHNPLLLAAGFSTLNPPLPWLGGRLLRLLFG